MIEKYISQGTMRPLKWWLGAIIGVLGFASLFLFDKSMTYIHRYPYIFSVLLIIGGYLLTISGKRK